MAEAQTAGLEPDNKQEPGEGDHVAPKSTTAVKKDIVKVHKAIAEQVQLRTDANEQISALREQLVSKGFSKKAQAAVESFMNLNEDDQRDFDIAVQIMRSALGKPVQTTLDLVHVQDNH